MVGKITDLKTLKPANSSSITSEVLVHRTGRNNRKTRVTNIAGNAEKRWSFGGYVMSILKAYSSIFLFVIIFILQFPMVE